MAINSLRKAFVLIVFFNGSEPLCYILIISPSGTQLTFNALSFFRMQYKISNMSNGILDKIFIALINGTVN